MAGSARVEGEEGDVCHGFALSLPALNSGEGSIRAFAVWRLDAHRVRKDSILYGTISGVGHPVPRLSHRPHRVFGAVVQGPLRASWGGGYGRRLRRGRYDRTRPVAHFAMGVCHGQPAVCCWLPVWARTGCTGSPFDRLRDIPFDVAQGLRQQTARGTQSTTRPIRHAPLIDVRVRSFWHRRSIALR